jgi:uncharacterized protein DUF6788
MTERQALAARKKILRQLPDLSLVLRGSLFERTIRHNSGCPKCERGEGHPLWVLNVVYPGGRTRQVSLRPEQAQQAREWIDNYHGLKEALEQISELNQALLRDQRDSLKRRERVS